MKDKAIVYVVGILIIILLVQNIQMYLLKKKANSVLLEQITEFELLKEQNLAKLDSIELLKNNKVAVIAEKEKSLYGNVAKAKENNIRYEKIKENISNTNDADSLARQLTNRYSKR